MPKRKHKNASERTQKELRNMTDAERKALAKRKARASGQLETKADREARARAHERLQGEAKDPAKAERAAQLPSTPHRDESNQWVPGVPNGGRAPSLKHVRDLAREHTEEAVAALTEIMNNKKAPAAARVSAANAILDRGFGRVPSDIPLTDEKPITEFTMQQLIRAAARHFEDEDRRRRNGNGVGGPYIEGEKVAPSGDDDGQRST